MGGLGLAPSCRRTGPPRSAAQDRASDFENVLFLLGPGLCQHQSKISNQESAIPRWRTATGMGKVLPRLEIADCGLLSFDYSERRRLMKGREGVVAGLREIGRWFWESSVLVGTWTLSAPIKNQQSKINNQKSP